MTPTTLTGSVVAYQLRDLRTGEHLADLPLDAPDDVVNVMAREDQQTFNLLVEDDACPEDWQAQVEPHKTMITETEDGFLTQAWAVIDIETGEATVPITAATLEHCATWANVNDLYDSLDEAAVTAALADPLVAQFGFVIETTPTGRIADNVAYSGDETRDVLSAITERMKTSGGAEWRMYPRWTDDTHRFVDKVLQIGPTIGVKRPDVIFDLDASGYGTVESYKRKKTGGATALTGSTEGSGGGQTTVGPFYAEKLILDGGWPVWAERKVYTALAASDDEDATLTTRVKADLAAQQLGVVTWQIVATANADRPGRDYLPGDTVRIDIPPQGKRDPAGGRGEVRLLGYSRNKTSGQVTLAMWEDDDG